MLVKGTETNIFFSSGKRDKSCVPGSSVNACASSLARSHGCAHARVPGNRRIFHEILSPVNYPDPPLLAL